MKTYRSAGQILLELRRRHGIVPKMLRVVVSSLRSQALHRSKLQRGHSLGHMTVAAAVDGVVACLNYTIPPPSNSHLYMYLDHLPQGKQPSNIVPEPHQIFISNLRAQQQHFNLRDNGFELADIFVKDNIDWTDKDEVSYGPLLALRASCKLPQCCARHCRV